MPRRSSPALPSYRHYKPKDLAVVRLNGRDHYLGSYGSPESREKYDRLISEWLAGGRSPLPRTDDPSAAPPSQGATDELSVNEVLLAYWRFAEQHYVQEGKPSKELACMRHAIRPVRELYGLAPAKDFGPKALKAVRAHMVAQGLCRRMVNARVNRIRRVFKWAASEELVPPAVHEGLRTVAGLQYGRTTATESKPVKPADPRHVEAVLPFVTPQIAAMVRLQMVTGMRAAEVVMLRPGDIDRTADVWIYRPATHKTAHLGHEKLVPFGPQAQEIIRPFLDRSVDTFLFSPREAEVWRNDRRGVSRNPNRKTKIYPCELKARLRRKATKAGRPAKRPKRERYYLGGQVTH